jgi:hypothetical protein
LETDEVSDFSFYLHFAYAMRDQSGLIGIVGNYFNLKSLGFLDKVLLLVTFKLIRDAGVAGSNLVVPTS